MSKPFLKWAGGKRWQLEHLLPIVSERLTPESVFFDPFLGGGAVPLALHHPRCYLSDANSYLIATYLAVQENCWDVAVELKRLVDRYNDGPAREVYEAVREEWNLTKDDRFRPRSLQAALFTFLNRTCFNGLYRENSRGIFNVPWGKKHPFSWNVMGDSLSEVHERLVGAHLRAHDFGEIEALVRAGDVVYFDPPYFSEGNFTSYTAKGFGLDEHRRLAQLAVRLREKGAHVIASGSDTNGTRLAYKEFSKVTEVVARRSIGAKTREKAKELIMIA